MGITIIHAADWHIGDFKGPERDGVNLRSLDTRRCLEFMAARAEGGRRAGNLRMRAEAGNLHTAGREGGPETAEKDPAYRTEKECSAES